MNYVISSNHISLYRSLFRGREDAFAIRWEKEGKSGYLPSCTFDPYMYRLHKLKGGNFQNYADKSYRKFTEGELVKHLNGEQFVGIYPLLQDNTSWFIVADFDESNWVSASQKLLSACNDNDLPAYLERSRSGKGGHVWIFFEQPYPAIKSRKVILSVLTTSGIISPFDKNSSFDRLFPNQDKLSGKGLGNLIALPLFKPALMNGNNCFIHSETLEPYSDQWNFLSGIKRASIHKLDELFERIPALSPATKLSLDKHSHTTLVITINNTIQINRVALPILLVDYLKNELNFLNSEFLIKKKTGRNTFGTERYFRFIDETETDVILPKGFARKLLLFCRHANIEYELNDERNKRPLIDFNFVANLRPFQIAALTESAKKEMGVIVAPPGSGKTIIGLNIIAVKKQPALIVVHRIQLLDQWMERIHTFLGIPKQDIGKIAQGKVKIGKHVTVATIQSLSKEIVKSESKLKEAFGTIIIDECHHIPSQTYRNTIQQLNSYYLYGLTATPFRKYNDGRLIFIHLGMIIAEIKTNNLENVINPKIIIRNTDFDIPFNPKTDRFETLSKMLVHDSSRNKLILKDVIIELNEGKRIVIITERKEHIESLYQFLKQNYEVITLSGDDAESERLLKWLMLKAGNYQTLITTGQFFGEGTDLQTSSTLFLVYPFSFEGKLIQYIGRVQRSEITPVIYDYRDIKIDYLDKLFLKRNTYYRKLEKQSSLFDDHEKTATEKNKVLSIEREISVDIEMLEFNYGSISFKHNFLKPDVQLEFVIENNNIRPEFDVLKPYFAKELGSKYIRVWIFAEFLDGQVISQSANSADNTKINREIIEAVRFRFVFKHFLGKGLPQVHGSLLTTNLLQDGESLYDSGEELLNDLLIRKQFRHSVHLRYLAQIHSGHILKIRFVLTPFSFIFLLEGSSRSHIILETLDTEEATYLWHLDQGVESLRSGIKEIDRQLDIIRNKGRQVFLSSPPTNFSRILHDYSDEQKGFVIWKDMLEERIT